MNWQTATEEDREKVKNWMEQNAPDDWANLKSFKVMGAILQDIERCKRMNKNNSEFILQSKQD